MPRKKKTWKLVGAAPVEVDGKTYYPGDTFEASEGEVAFLVQIGAVEVKKD